MRRIKAQLFVGLVIASLTAAAYLLSPDKFQALDNQLRDYLFYLRGYERPSSDIVIVDIDERSLKALGQWPWKRKYVAQILENLSRGQAGIIGLDIVFSEYDNSNPAKIFKELGLKRQGLEDYDKMLSRAVADSPTILGYVFKMEDDGVDERRVPSIPAVFVERGRGGKEYLLRPFRALLNIPMLQESAYSSGFFNSIPDDDSGMIRSVPLVLKYDGIVYPSLSLEMIRIMMDQKKVFINYDKNIGVQNIEAGALKIPTDQFGRMLVNYRGPAFSFKYLSALDIYKGDFKPEDIAGKLVLVGTSSAGLLDLRATPFDSAYPGVEIHASVLDNILKGDFIVKPSWVVAADMAQIFGVGTLLSLALSFGGAVASVISFTLFVVAQLYFNYSTLFGKGIALNILFDIVILSLALFSASLVLNYFLEIRQNNIIRRKFSSKVSPDVMEDILKHSSSRVWDGDEKEITIFFSDIRGFTNISEAIGDAKSLIKLMNEIMEPMTEIIIKEHGTIDKYIGDAIMAYWNAPHDVKDHADRAVIASLKQLYALEELNARIRKNRRYSKVTEMSDKAQIPIVDIGIGLNSGVAIVGEMGSAGRSDYTVIGDPINLGSRLESLCKYYGSHLNISHFTKERLKGDYIYRFLDLVKVKGKSEPVEIWQIHDFMHVQELALGGSSKESLLEELKAYHKGITLYKKGAFEKALTLFESINSQKERSNVKIYDIYIERCRHYIAFPPKDFDAVFVHTSKG